MGKKEKHRKPGKTEENREKRGTQTRQRSPREHKEKCICQQVKLNITVNVGMQTSKSRLSILHHSVPRTTITRVD